MSRRDLRGGFRIGECGCVCVIRVAGGEAVLCGGAVVDFEIVGFEIGACGFEGAREVARTGASRSSSSSDSEVESPAVTCGMFFLASGDVEDFCSNSLLGFSTAFSGLSNPAAALV